MFDERKKKETSDNLNLAKLSDSLKLTKTFIFLSLIELNFYTKRIFDLVSGSKCINQSTEKSICY